MSMYSTFETDNALEQSGVVVDYGPFRVTIARAGGSNQPYTKALERAVQPYKRAIATNSLDEETQRKIMYKVYSETVVKNWEVKVGDEWRPGIEAPNGETLPFNPENVLLTFNNLPDLFADLQQQAQNQVLYRREIMEDDAKNS